MIKSITEDFGNGGTIDGDLTISGDLQVSGGGSLSFDEIVQGTQVIDVTNTEALLVRKNDDGGDVFIVDTTNSRIGINSTPSRTFQVDGTASATTATGYFYTNAIHTGVDTQSVVSIRSDNASSTGDVLHVQGDGTGNLLTLSKDGSDKLTVTHEGNVGIGTASPTSKLSVSAGRGANTGLEILDSADSNNKRIDLRLDADGDGYLSLVDASETTKVQLYSNGVSYFNGGNVGIGVTSPTHNLNVYNGSGASNMTIGKYASGKTVALLGTSADTSGYFQIQSYASQGSTFGNIVLNAQGGNVGIGTTSPTRQLTLAGAGSAIKIDSSDNAYIEIDRGASSDVGQLKFMTGGSAKWYAGMADSGSTGFDGTEFFIGEGSGGASDAHLVIDASGNVGIGTTSPLQGQSTPISNVKLDVLGNQMLSNLSTTNTDQSKLFFFRSDGAVSSQGVVPDGLKMGAIEWDALTSGDNNNSIASARIETEASNTWSSASVRNADITFSTIGANSLTEKMRIDNSGNVGIGTASPTTKLTVLGSMDDNIIKFGAGSAQNIALGVTNDRDATRVDFFLATEYGAESWSKRVTVTNQGKVGIGTTSPSGILSIFRNDSSTVGTNDVVIENDGSGDASLKFSLTGATDWYAYVDNSDSDKFKIRRSTTDHFSIDESGNATFSGNVQVKNSGFVFSAGAITIQSGSSTNVVLDAGAGADEFTLSDSALNITVPTTFSGNVTSNGNILSQGASAPSISVLDTTNNASIQMRALDTEVRFGSTSNHPVKIGTNDSYDVLVLGTDKSATFGGDITVSSATDTKPILKLEQTGNNVNGGQFIFLTSGTANDNDLSGVIRFKGMNDAGTPEEIEYATIYAKNTDVSDGSEDGELHFRTMSAGSLDSRLTLSSSNATFSGSINTQDITAYNMITIESADISNGENNGLRLINTSGTDHYWHITNGQTGVSNENFTIRDGTNNRDIVVLETSSGNATFYNRIILGGGITFPASQNASSNANTLDDYEEGTWTPTYACSSGSFNTLTMDIISATYTKIGRQVTVRADIRTDSVNLTGASGTLQLTGLPFTVDEDAILIVGQAYNWVSNNFPFSGRLLDGTTNILLIQRDTSNGATSSMVPADLTAGVTADQNGLAIAATYFV
jgi:hypothetical protein